MGLKRANNEDVFVARPELGFCLAADGMGGAAAGELASRFFAETVTKAFTGADGRSEVEVLDRVQTAFNMANQRILEHVKQNPGHRGMGCTAELMAFADKGFVLGHVGDSRTYRLRDGRLKRLTQDHSLVQNQLDQGLITPEEALHHRLRNIILRAVGISDNLALDLLQGKIFSGDLFLLCSDGLTDRIDDEIIQRVLSFGTNLIQKADQLIESAKSAGGEDNITVVLARVL